MKYAVRSHLGGTVEFLDAGEKGYHAQGLNCVAGGVGAVLTIVEVITILKCRIWLRSTAVANDSDRNIP